MIIAVVTNLTIIIVVAITIVLEITRNTNSMMVELETMAVAIKVVEATVVCRFFYMSIRSQFEPGTPETATKAPLQTTPGS